MEIFIKTMAVLFLGIICGLMCGNYMPIWFNMIMGISMMALVIYKVLKP